MFYCNAGPERDANFIKAESLQIDLIAGGLNWKQQHHIMERLKPNIMSEVSTTMATSHEPLYQTNIFIIYSFRVFRISVS